MISNTNGLIKWEKTACNKYTVTNLTTNPVDVTITGETNTFTKTFTIELSSSAEFEVPSDGVYKICVDGENVDVVVNGTETPTETNSYIAVYSFLDTGPTAFVLHSDSDGASVYNESVDGVSDTSNSANFTSSLLSYYGATGAELIAPTVVPTNFSWLGADQTNWRVVIKVTAAFFTPSSFNFIRVRSAIDGSLLDLTPTLYNTHTFSGYTGTNNWLTNFEIGTISSINLLDGPTSPFLPRYDLSDPVVVDQFKIHAESYLLFNGTIGYFYQDGSNYTFAILDNEDDITSFSYSDLTVTTTEIQWCDYLYELCSLHTCIISKLRDMLCNECDPCKPCDESVTNKSNKARKDLLYINTLFFNGLVPLITEDRLNYMGDLVIDETRIECTMRIKELFTKLTDFAKRCGECEECEDCDCDCLPNTTTKCNNC